MTREIEKKIMPVKIIKPDELIIDQIRGLLQSGELKPGHKLPPERVLAERFNVGRGYVRLALQKLEYFGVIYTRNQSGSYISELGIVIIDGLLANIVSMRANDMNSIIEARLTIETATAGLAALRATNQSLVSIKDAFNNYESKINQGTDAIEEDVLFHIRIAEASENVVLQTMIMVLAGEVVRKTKNVDGCRGNRKYIALEEHREILNAIIQKNEELARKAMRKHLKNTLIIDTRN